MLKNSVLTAVISLVSSAIFALEPAVFVGKVLPVPQKHYRGAPENGYPVTVIHVKPGDLVQKDQVVIELDPAVLPLNLRKAQVGVAEGDLAILLAKQEVREKVLARCKRLHATKAVSTEELDLAQECIDCLGAEIVRAKASLKAAQVAYAQAEYNHNTYEIMKSPIAGEVVRVNCALGQCGRAEKEQVVWVEVIDSSVVQIHFSVPLQTAKSLSRGSVVVISQDGKTWEATLPTVTKLADENGQIPVIVEMPNTDKTLICGTKVWVSIKR